MMRWLLILLLTTAPAMAETVTTENVTPDMSAFTASGSTQIGRGCVAGQFCTGNAGNGGGTYRSSFDVPLTEAEIQRGFTVNQFVDVTSHPSNATLETCGSVTQVGDCRDIFSMTVALFDITNTVVEKFEREIELDFSGTRTFTFADEVAPNTFSLLTGEFELFGIDAGFHSSGSAFGPQFAVPGVTFTYQDIVEQQVLEQIAQLDTQIAFTPPPTEIAAAPPPPTAAPQPVQTVAAYAEPAAPAPPPVVAQIQTPQPEPQEQQQEAQIEAAIETEMQAQPEPQAEQQQEQRPEPENGEQAEAEPEQQAEPQEAVEPEPEPAPEQQQAEAEPETKQEKQKAAAERVVKKIAPSQRYSAAGQATTMVVMNMLAGKIATDVGMIDTQGFFPATGMNDDRSMSNPLQDYTMFGGSNAAHDQLMQIEWNR
tara:strand:- start:1163 stop:2440 length:1278 start_codon:yes stop_codon:yes gene_type:complete